MTKFNARVRLFVIVLAMLIASLMSACSGTDTGGTIVETISTGRTQAEQTVHDIFGCNPETALYGCNADGSFK